MVRRSIISFNNAILVFIDRDKNWVWKVKKREVKVLYHLSCGYLCYIISSSWYSFPMIQPKVWSKSDSCTYMIVLCAQLLSHVWLFLTPMDSSPPGSRQEYWIRLPCFPPGDLPGPGIKPRSPALQANSLPAELPGKPTYVVTDSQMIESE